MRKHSKTLLGKLINSTNSGGAQTMDAQTGSRPQIAITIAQSDKMKRDRSKSYIAPFGFSTNNQKQ